jgi:hypothetical protein
VKIESSQQLEVEEDLSESAKSRDDDRENLMNLLEAEEEMRSIFQRKSDPQRHWGMIDGEDSLIFEPRLVRFGSHSVKSDPNAMKTRI